MKLRNLLFGTMIALAFTACSSDNDPIVTPEPQPDPTGETTFSMKMGAITKAEGDATINSLTAVVINADNKIEKIQKATTNMNEVRDIPVSAGVKQVIMVANVDLADFGIVQLADNAPADAKNSKEDLLQVLSIADELETADNLSMNSKLFGNINIIAGQKHYLGFTNNEYSDGGVYYPNEEGKYTEVKLYRNVAKITLGSVTLGKVMIKLEGTNTEVELTDAKFVMDQIAIVQSMAKSYLVAKDYSQWGETFYEKDAEKGYYVSGYDDDYATLAAGTRYAKSASPEYNAHYYRGKNITLTGESKTYEDDEVFYVYENMNKVAGVEGDILTLLTIRGTISGTYTLNDVVQNISMDKRYYTVAMGVSGTIDYSKVVADDYPAARTRGGIMRNLNYNIDAELTGLGSASPFGPPPGGEGGELNVRVRVVTWGEVVQSATFE